MLNYDLQHDDGILVLNPDGPFEAENFTTLAGHVDACLAQYGSLHGVLIRAKSFPGWKDFGALVTHLKFVREHHQRIEKVAVVANGAFATIMPRIAGYIVHPQVQHFDLAEEDAAWDWLRQSGTMEIRSAA